MDIDLEQLKLSDYKFVPQKNTKKIKKFGKGKEFIHSLPLSWILPIFKQHNYLTSIALATWHLFNLNKRPPVFKFSYKMAKLFGVKRTTAWRGLRKLSGLGLIKISSIGKGKSPIISVIINIEEE